MKRETVPWTAQHTALLCGDAIAPAYLVNTNQPPPATSGHRLRPWGLSSECLSRARCYTSCFRAHLTDQPWKVRVSPLMSGSLLKSWHRKWPGWGRIVGHEALKPTFFHLQTIGSSQDGHSGPRHGAPGRVPALRWTSLAPDGCQPGPAGFPWRATATTLGFAGHMLHLWHIHFHFTTL